MSSSSIIPSFDSKDIIIGSIKVVDIAYITTFQFILGYTVGMFIDTLFIKVLENEDSGNARLLAEILLQVVVSVVIVWILRNIVQKIPFPLDGVSGFEHKRLKELNSPLLDISLFTAQRSLVKKILRVYEVVNDKVLNADSFFCSKNKQKIEND